MTNGTELGIFLKARRAAVRPEDVGLPEGPGIRRTPGLRREEVATLAGVSVDYYTRLERGKEANPSPAVVDSLARILKLSADEHEHLRRLAQHGSGARRAAANRVPAKKCVRQGPLVLMESLRPNPAYVVSKTNDILAANPAGLALFHGITDWPASLRNVTRYIFLHPEAKKLYPEWEKLVPTSVAFLRARAGADPDDPDLTKLIGELVVKSPEFARLWERYEVNMVGQGTKKFQHPLVGAMTLDYEAMELTNSGGQRLVAYYTLPGTPDRDAVTLLDMIGSGLASGDGGDGAGLVVDIDEFLQGADGQPVERGDGSGVSGEHQG